MTLDYQYHPAAGIFPLLTGDEFESLKKDIQTNGLCEPIVLFEGKILDGRNRYNACAALGIEPKFVTYEGTDPLSYVISLNLHRRHLTETQRAVVAARLANMGIGNFSKSANLPISPVTQPEAAQMLNVSERTLRTVKAIERDAPDMLPKLESGEMTAHEAYKEVKTKARTEDIQRQRADIEKGTHSLPAGVFEVIVLDPPWMYGTEYDPNGRRAANPYPEMSLEQIQAISLPAAKDCVLWLWTTHKFMRHSFALIDEWGFRDVMILTWVKDRMGLGSWLRSKSEFCIMAVRGNPVITLTTQTTVLEGKMREHSRKPDEFYSMVDSLCVGRKLDYFSREPRQGWEQYGNDPAKFGLA